MSDELKSCVCGANAGTSWSITRNDGIWHHAGCRTCGRRGPRARTHEGAIAAWNRRVVTREQVIAAARALHAEDANDGLLVLPFDEEADDPFHRRAAIAAFRAAGFEVAE